ncbi:unnamed protein product [Anisakis simplex]|uniref:UDP-glucose:glycoprotein glucosyltransferase (inferred by orthology to a D. melanogaster protein) n=1 Tax=Anisakis simplex TaxID=6269 RepID=A0A0M3KJ15_ANISI|nr:unnamed protein product [Anisakis simplex]
MRNTVGFNHTNTESEGVDEVNVLIDSFSGRTIRVRVSKKEGKQDENLLSEGKQTDDDVDEESQSIWSSISSKLSGGEKYETINIFSLASGHLYERFIRIMMLSVMKHTKHPVKFWLLKNYLSPHFKVSSFIYLYHCYSRILIESVRIISIVNSERLEEISLIVENSC